MMGEFPAWQARVTGLLKNPEPGYEIAGVIQSRACRILSALGAAGVPTPNIFPTEENSISLEWADATRVRSIEVHARHYELFLLPEKARDAATSVRVKTSREVIDFARQEAS